MTQSMRNDTPVMGTLREIIDNNGAGKVFGDPIDQDGTIVLPVAKVGGGGGGGGPAQGTHEAGGTGGGLGVAAKPLGVFVIKKEGEVGWKPALDLNKVIMGGQIVAVVGLLTARAIIKARRKRK